MIPCHSYLCTFHPSGRVYVLVGGLGLCFVGCVGLCCLVVCSGMGCVAVFCLLLMMDGMDCPGFVVHQHELSDVCCEIVYRGWGFPAMKKASVYSSG